MTTTPDRILLCSCGTERFGIDLSHLADVMPLCPLQPVPRTPSHIRGIAPMHGVLTPVLDLHAYLGGGSGSGQGQYLRVNPAIASLALWVDGVERIADCPEGSTRPESGDDDLFPRTVRLAAGDEVRLLHVPLLVDRLEAALAGA